MEITWLLRIIAVNALVASMIACVTGHGRLLDPPSRNAMWRLGFANPVNYDDNELYCGGYSMQWERNKGKCGVCGDAYGMKRAPHVAGGEYANGIIGRRYVAGQTIPVVVELTANHMGWFELRLCPNNNPKVKAKQRCFDKYPLYLAGKKASKFLIPEGTKDNSTITFKYHVQLPPFLTCTQCVVQWTYYTGNMWGTCPDGTEAVGCGNPETFRNCADVAILSNSANGVSPKHMNKTRKKSQIFVSNRQ